ncbi:MAG TPA: 2OG-Fe(II) oxygenase [Abditibacterium sp.]|jgi:predicted 2-oxoglutarate/Fe(II)-dependent dioxygenase YbiX
MKPHILIPKRLLTIADFFSKEECAAHIARSEGDGYEAATISTKFGAVMRQDIRNNARLICDDAELAQSLWERVKPFVPSPLFGREAIGLNERLRYYRYEAGQVFKAHQDGSFKRENGEKSQITFMVYLNEEFSGGATTFDLRYPYGEMEVVPKTGMALLFLHSFRHEGAIVTSGSKYVLRSDVMYSAQSSEDDEE